MAVIVIGLAVGLRSQISPGLLGVALTSVMGIGMTLSMLIQMWTQLETSLGAITRVNEFANDTPREDDGPDMPPPQWPSRGAISVQHLEAKYGDRVVLEDINLEIQPGEKVAICGRSGSGKSTLISLLLRLYSPSQGQIEIDGIETGRLNLNALRESLVALPQDPMFLAGTVRYNLDPLGKATDDELLAVLDKTNLKKIIDDKGGLDADLDTDWLSAGQRQLFCLARALTRKSRVLLLDEATSSLDRETEAFVDKLVQEDFAGWTAIVVAHRLRTVADFDKVLVLQEGQVMEYDSPKALLARDSLFKTLWDLQEAERARHTRERRGVNDAQALDAADTELGVEDGKRIGVAANGAGAACVVGVGLRLEERALGLVGAVAGSGARARVLLVEGQDGVAGGLPSGAQELGGVSEMLEVFGAVVEEEVEVDIRGDLRVGACELDGAGLAVGINEDHGAFVPGGTESDESTADGLLAEGKQAAFIIVGEALADTGQVLDDGDVEFRQLGGRADAAKLENLGTVEGAARNDDLTAGPDLGDGALCGDVGVGVAGVGAIERRAGHNLDAARDRKGGTSSHTTTHDTACRVAGARLVKENTRRQRVQPHRQRVVLGILKRGLDVVVGARALAALVLVLGHVIEARQRVLVRVVAQNVLVDEVGHVAGVLAPGRLHRRRQPAGETVALGAGRQVLVLFDFHQVLAHVGGLPARVARHVDDDVPVVVRGQRAHAAVVHGAATEGAGPRVLDAERRGSGGRLRADIEGAVGGAVGVVGKRLFAHGVVRVLDPEIPARVRVVASRVEVGQLRVDGVVALVVAGLDEQRRVSGARKIARQRTTTGTATNDDIVIRGIVTSSAVDGDASVKHTARRRTTNDQGRSRQ
ncbi:hypothetical protein SPBR_02260 [Sporothrix brasiliensis 5110]|uniref:ABC transporter domain-containing protein n=1 Tax=Sporothrix brasiliensis 5110 TaxID=1398154 RepID=A0A0C2EZU3_9PEZI|nr:uncharacterized protein SPBR_02260 [Sporothrix brasiliensis 5110]KIH92059.1 hypothetical protein SPBR_02260 [Sporothrix brasiliensis 5110]